MKTPAQMRLGAHRKIVAAGSAFQIIRAASIYDEANSVAEVAATQTFDGFAIDYPSSGASEERFEEGTLQRTGELRVLASAENFPQPLAGDVATYLGFTWAVADSQATRKSGIAIVYTVTLKKG